MTDFIHGLIGGFVGTIISHPVDTIKTRIQTNLAINARTAIKMGKLYSGICAPLFGIGLEKSIVFGTYAHVQNKYNLNVFSSGLIAGFISTIIVVPVDKIKILLQNKKPLSSINVKNLYHGFSVTLFRETPGFGIYFSTYKYLTDNFNKDKSLSKSFLFGSISGINSWIFIYPADLIKTKMQNEIATNNNLKQTIINIYKKNGITGFYSGFKFAIFRAVPLHGGVFMGYEISKKYSN